MTGGEILARVEAVARRAVGHRGRLSPELRLSEDLRLDSVKALTLAVELENHFRITITPEDEARIATVGDLVRVIQDRLDDPR